MNGIGMAKADANAMSLDSRVLKRMLQPVAVGVDGDGDGDADDLDADLGSPMTSPEMGRHRHRGGRSQLLVSDGFQSEPEISRSESFSFFLLFFLLQFFSFFLNHRLLLWVINRRNDHEVHLCCFIFH